VLTAETQLLRVRVAWIDAPERSQAFGQRAKQAMSSLVFGKDVERFHAIDRYGRLVCMVFVDGQDAGLELIKEGFAWVYSKYLPEASGEIQQSYTAAEAAARAARIDLWADADPQPPWEFRRAEREGFCTNWHAAVRENSIDLWARYLPAHPPAQISTLAISTVRCFVPAVGHTFREIVCRHKV
jgi:Staphylococcal nuclease homologue